MNNADKTQVPWYRHGYVWLLITFPLAAVLGGIATIYIAVVTDDGLVTDDYYKQGLAINRSLARDQRAVELGLTAQLDVIADGQQLRVALNGAAQIPEQLQLGLFHATRPGLDRVLLLPRLQSGYFQAPLPQLASGTWNIELATADWRLVGRLRQPDEARATLVPGASSR